MAALDTLRTAFFEECEDLLLRMGEGLGRIADPDSAGDTETVHDVFRAVHSIKGGAGAFGLGTLVGFAHAFETVLDHMRGGRLAPDAAAMHVLLRAYDVLSDLVAAARDGTTEPTQMSQILLELDLLADGGPAPEDEGFDFQPMPLDLSALDETASGGSGLPGFDLLLAPDAAFYAAGHEPLSLLRALSAVGDVRVATFLDAVPPLTDLDLAAPNLRWQVTIDTAAPRDEIAAIFDFVDDACVTITERALGPIQGEGDAQSGQTIASPAVHVLPPRTDASPRPTGDGATAPTPLPATIRVNLDRVDRLINQIGELVIREAMLSQAISTAGLQDDSDIVGSLEGIKQLAANIQECVMAIRAQPLKSVFQRMERITREAADATGKQVRLLTLGETTEVDKTVIERLVDPLTHMIRNSVDHGIESTARRLAAGKPAEGVITLSAAHRSGRVMIEVVDDGAGIDRTRVRELAESRGLVPAGAQLAPHEIDNLLFLPGFSSKEEVSALSGRGVGLDVVRREIQSLGGRVTIQSTPGQGTTFTIALPLTLAVLEGMLIGVGGETMVLPLSAIIETLRPEETHIHRLGRSGRLIANRGEMIPIIDLADGFGFPASGPDGASVLILVECDSGRRAALAVDRIFDQRQVVIKSLEDNYGSVAGISAATILGDGRIALIVDPEEVVRRAVADAPPLSLAANG